VWASIRDLTFRDRPPVGPSQHVSKVSSGQAASCRGSWRVCLLKGCGRGFRSSCARVWYCSAECLALARRWVCWKAQQRYRSSAQGRARRREQSRRWRQRQKEKRSKPSETPAKNGCEGHPRRRRRGEFSCDRPGCYDSFARSARSPWQRFCSALCRGALRLVRLRERRWQGRCGSCPLKLWTFSDLGVRSP
jgi:hypothetical protein